MGRTTEGRLYVAGKKRLYYLRYTVNGKDCRVRLLGLDGKPITTASEAKKAAARLLHPLKEMNRAEQMRILQSAIQGAEESAEQAQALLVNSKASLLHGWELFMSCQSRPASCKRFPMDEIPRHSTPGNYAGYYRQFSGWMHDKHPEILLLSGVTPEIAGEYTCYLESLKISPGTFNKVIQFFKMFYSVLLDDEKVPCKNPFLKINRKEQVSNSRAPLSMEQIAALIQNAEGELRLLIALGYFTGLRFGDCCTLLWREVDLVRGVIERIPRKTKHTRKDKKEAVVKVGIPAFLYRMLAEIPDHCRKGYVLPRFGADYDRGADANLNGIVIKHFQKCGIQTHKEGTGIKTVLDENGEPVIDEKTGKPKKTGKRAVVEVSFHSLRYSYVSHNAEMGTPAAVIQRNVGHSCPAMTEHYTRISDDAARRYANVLQLPQVPDDTSDASYKVLEPEREELHRLADILPINEVKELLKLSDKFWDKK